jgi:hypothetical protein
VKRLAEKGDWLRATRQVISVKKGKGTVPVPFFSGQSSYDLAHRKKGTGTGRVSWFFPTIWPIPLGASPPFCDSHFHFDNYGQKYTPWGVIKTVIVPRYSPKW